MRNNEISSTSYGLLLHLNKTDIQISDEMSIMFSCIGLRYSTYTTPKKANELLHFFT